MVQAVQAVPARVLAADVWVTTEATSRVHTSQKTRSCRVCQTVIKSSAVEISVASEVGEQPEKGFITAQRSSAASQLTCSPCRVSGEQLVPIAGITVPVGGVKLGVPKLVRMERLRV